MKEKPLVSVVVATRNEEKNIEKCLCSVKAQTYPAEMIEMVVVDNSSEDRTKEIARKFTDLVFNKGPERSAQRNYGILEVATGRYVMFLDADMILAPKTVEKAVEKMSGGDCVALYIPEIVLGTKYFSRVRRFERSFYDGKVIDAARFFRRDIFQEVGGFNVRMIAGEDWDLDKEFRRKGRVELLCIYDYRMVQDFVTSYSPEELIEAMKKKNFAYPVLFHNEAEINLCRYLAKKAFYTGYLDRYIEKWGADDPDVREQIGFFYRFLGVFLEQGMWRRLLRQPILTVGMYFLRFSVGLVFLASKLRPRSSD